MIKRGNFGGNGIALNSIQQAFMRFFKSCSIPLVPPKSNLKASHNPRNDGFFLLFSPPTKSSGVLRTMFSLGEAGDRIAKLNKARHAVVRQWADYLNVLATGCKVIARRLSRPEWRFHQYTERPPRVASIQGLPPVGPHGNSIVPVHSRSSRSE